MDKFIVTKYHSLESASKILNSQGEPLRDDNEPSEWAVAYALMQFDIGQEITEEDFCEKLNEAMIQQSLDSLVEDGRVEMLWDENRNDFVYKVKE
jgi:hypothetical protein